MLEQQFGAEATWTEPTNVVEITDGTRLTPGRAGLRGAARARPHRGLGDVRRRPRARRHREQVDVDRTMVSGDVLFAGSIGRTDLPGGDPAAMQRSLRDVVLPLPDTTLVLPGHCQATTMAHERATNPYLQGLARVSTPSAIQGRQGHPDQRLPRVPPGRAHRRAALPRRHPRDVRAARVLLRSRPASIEPHRPAAARKGEDADKEIYAVSRLAGGSDERRRAGACTST